MHPHAPSVTHAPPYIRGERDAALHARHAPNHLLHLCSTWKQAQVEQQINRLEPPSKREKKPMLTKSEIKDETDAMFFGYAYVEEEEVQNLKELLDDLLEFKDADECCALLRRFHQILSSPKKWAAWRDEQRRDEFTFQDKPRRPPTLHVVK
jgi:hypothetical protein